MSELGKRGVPQEGRKPVIRRLPLSGGSSSTSEFIPVSRKFGAPVGGSETSLPFVLKASTGMPGDVPKHAGQPKETGDSVVFRTPQETISDAGSKFPGEVTGAVGKEIRITNTLQERHPDWPDVEFTFLWRPHRTARDNADLPEVMEQVKPDILFYEETNERKPTEWYQKITDEDHSPAKLDALIDTTFVTINGEKMRLTGTAYEPMVRALGEHDNREGKLIIANMDIRPGDAVSVEDLEVRSYGFTHNFNEQLVNIQQSFRSAASAWVGREVIQSLRVERELEKIIEENPHLKALKGKRSLRILVPSGIAHGGDLDGQFEARGIKTKSNYPKEPYTLGHRQKLLDTFKKQIVQEGQGMPGFTPSTHLVARAYWEQILHNAFATVQTEQLTDSFKISAYLDSIVSQFSKTEIASFHGSSIDQAGDYTIASVESTLEAKGLGRLPRTNEELSDYLKEGVVPTLLSSDSIQDEAITIGELSQGWYNTTPMRFPEGIELLNTRAVVAERRKHRSEVRRLTKKERGGWDWTIEDSPLSSRDNHYAFENHFAALLPEGEGMQSFIERKLAHRRGRAIGVELGGTGSRLFAGFTPGFFQRTAGVNLTDYRKFYPDDPTPADEQRNHTVVEGDILSRRTQKKLQDDFIKGDSIDFLALKMEGGSLMIAEPFFISQNANVYYQMLSENGLMFAEVPIAFWDLIDEWGSNVNESYQGRLDVTVRANGPYGGVLLNKTPDAPQELPLLSVPRVKELVGKRGKYSVLHQLFTDSTHE